MRGLLRDFADRGGTVLLSSHLLYEVEAIADRMVIIGSGKIMAQGTRAELLTSSATLVRAGDEAALGRGAERRRPGGARRDRRRLPRRRRARGRRPRRARRRRRPHPAPAVRRRRARAALLRPDHRGAGHAARRLRGGHPMSTAVRPRPRPHAGAADQRPGLGRLTLVELRKMTDTRAGFWLLLTTALLTVAVVVIAGLAMEEQDRIAEELRRDRDACRCSLLGPIVGILLVTSEWSQRTALITFALVPAPLARARREAARGRRARADRLPAVPRDRPAGDRDLRRRRRRTHGRCRPRSSGRTGSPSCSRVIAGIGFGAVLLASAPAIVLFFVLPTALGRARRDPRARGRREVARPEPHDGRHGRARAERRPSGRGSACRSRCGCSCRSCSASGA